jgi:hypothetical protein
MTEAETKCLERRNVKGLESNLSELDYIGETK